MRGFAPRAAFWLVALAATGWVCTAFLNYLLERGYALDSTGLTALVLIVVCVGSLFWSLSLALPRDTRPSEADPPPAPAPPATPAPQAEPEQPAVAPAAAVEKRGGGRRRSRR